MVDETLTLKDVVKTPSQHVRFATMFPFLIADYLTRL